MVKAGHKFTLDVPTQGEPVPEVHWARGEEVRKYFTKFVKYKNYITKFVYYELYYEIRKI